MRLGLLGGTFDPIHLGHLRAAENAREALSLDEVLFVPSGNPPHRPGPAASPLDRYAMVCLATAANPCFVPSPLELQRDGRSYTVDTVEGLQASRPEADLVLIVGSDSFPEMSGWRAAERLFASCEVAIVDRPGAPGAAAAEPERPFPASRGVRRVPGAGLPISASAVRRLAGEGRSIRYLVPEAVAGFVVKRGLYR